MPKPHTLTLRAYGVGFGDCFLLTFRYHDNIGDRHMLIDFGCTQKPPKAGNNLMLDIARDIAKTVGETLHVVVATHRHTDHVSGFATNGKGTGTGDIIAGLKPELVIMPWTEKPDAPADWKGPGKGAVAAVDDALRLSLNRMREVAAVSVLEAKHLTKDLKNEITFIGDDGIKNESAVRNLAKMGKQKPAYVSYGQKIPPLKTLFPGVSFTVLGPPTIRQKKDLPNQTDKNKDQFWHFTSFWKLQAMTSQLAPAGNGSKMFPRAKVFDPRDVPMEDRWFVRKVKDLRGAQLLRIVRSMDDALNNTSVILLMEAGTKKFLFPGDAQWENWEFALGKNLDTLKDVDVYKVGHHGSLNATPKTLWNNFKKRSTKKTDKGRLCTVMSTRTHSKHGHVESGTEVPREKLVNALQALSNLRSTQELEDDNELVLKIDFDLN
jgi:hypothetical protein